MSRYLSCLVDHVQMQFEHGNTTGRERSGNTLLGAYPRGHSMDIPAIGTSKHIFQYSKPAVDKKGCIRNLEI